MGGGTQAFNAARARARLIPTATQIVSANATAQATFLQVFANVTFPATFSQAANDREENLTDFYFASKQKLPSPWGIAAIWGRRCGAAAMFDGIFGPAASNSDTEELGSGEVDTQCSVSELQTMIHDWEHRDIPLPRTPPLAITDSTLAGKTPSSGQQDFVVADTNVETAAGAQDHGPDHCAPSSPPRCRSRSRSRLQSRLQHAHACAKATGIAVDRVAPLIEAYSAWQPQLVAHFEVLRSRQLQRYRIRSLLMEGVGVGMGSCGVGFQAMVCCGCVFCFHCVGENG